MTDMELLTVLTVSTDPEDNIWPDRAAAPNRASGPGRDHTPERI
jgi:hypothetical protein